MYGVPCPSSPTAVPVLGVIYAGPDRLMIYGPNTVVSCFN